MALSRVQATGRVTASAVTAVSLTFATPPVVGHAVVLLVANSGGGAPPTFVTDNQGHAYVLARAQRAGSTIHSAAVYYLSRVVTPSGRSR